MAITSIGDGVSTEMWGKLRAPLQQALAEKEKRVAQGFVVTRAVYGKLTVTETNVTEKVAALVRNNTLSISPSNATFGNADPSAVNSLQVQYTIGGASGSATASENENIDLAGALAIASAILTETKIDSSMDVTQKVAALLKSGVSSGTLSISATNATFGSDPAPNFRKALRVNYNFEGVPGSKTVKEGETLTLGSGPEPKDGDSLYSRYFEPPPESVAELAARLTNAGVKPIDFDPKAVLLSMLDELNELLGIAPDDLLDPLNAKPDAMDVPAEGVLLYHQQGWYARGLALGNLLHSVALAPGEVTQIAMTNWNHTTRSSSSEMVSQTDSTAQADKQNRAVTEIQDSTLQEHTSGQSAADSSSTSASSGDSSIKASGSVGFMSASGTISGTSDSCGSSNTVSNAVARNDDNKSLAMNSNQNISATTQRQAEASRTRRAAVVREVSQSENETLTTRVLANYNHMHALTVMYFEVIEVYNIKTRVVDADRLIFLPFMVRDVHELIPRFRSMLITAAKAAGKPEIAEAIHNNYKAGASDPKDLDPPIQQVQQSISQTSATLDGIRAEQQAISTQADSSRKNLNDTLASLNSQPAPANDWLAQMAAVGKNVQIQQVKTQLSQVNVSEQASLQLLRVRQLVTESVLSSLNAVSRQLNNAKLLLQNLEATLNDNRLFFNQAVWLSLSPSEVLGLARRRNVFKGESLCEQIDPIPVAVSGNYVAYRWGFADPVNRLAFKKQYVEPYVGDPDQELATVQASIAVPTGGVFGEAVLGCGVSAEKIDLSRFWNWKDSMIPILPTSINPLSAATPAVQNLSAEPGKLDESSAKLGPLQDLPAPSGFGALAQTMQAQVFRNMSGQDLLKTLAEATTQAAASSEQNAAQIASSNLKAGLNFMSDMASKALSAAAAPETGGASLLGGMLKSKDGGGASLLGGVLNAGGGAGAKGDLLSKLSGGKGDIVDQVENAVLGGGAAAGQTSGKTGGAGQTAAPGNAAGDSKIPADQLEDIGPPATKD